MNATAINSALRSIAGYGLPGSRPRFPDAPVDDTSWHTIIDGVRLQRIAPLLAQAITDGSFPTTSHQASTAVELEREALTNALAVEASLVGIAAVLDRAEIRFRVLKGSAVAHLDYPNPALREFGDVDLLIHPDDMDRTVETLAGDGFTRRFPEPRAGFDRRFTKSVSMTGPRGQEVDLHRTLAAGGFGQRILVGMLWAAPPDEFTVAGREMGALGAEERLLHACYHTVLGNSPPRLVPQRDLAQMLLTGPADTERVRFLAAAWRGESVLAHAVTTTWRNLHLTTDVPLLTWASGVTPRRRDARELARATSPTYTYAAQAVDSLRAIRGTRRRLAYISAMAFPRRSYLESRHAGFASRVRYAVSEIVATRTMTKENR